MYVISIKRIKRMNYDTHTLEMIPENEQEYEYFMYDRYAGSFSTGYPCFGEHCHAQTYKTPEAAKQAFERDKRLLRDTEMQEYDISTLAIRKVVYKIKEKLSL